MEYAINLPVVVHRSSLIIHRFHNLAWMLAAAGAVTAGVGAAVWASCDPRSPIWGPVRWRASDITQKKIAITFDDGPAPGATVSVLRTLEELNVPAAFFVIGRNARQWPELIRQMHERGHLVENHSFDHSHFGFLGGGKYWDRQLAETDRAVEDVTGQRPTLFRPPVGVRTPRLTAALRRSGHTQVTWSRRGLDGVQTTPELICGRLIGPTQPGDILVLHDGTERNGRRDPAAMLAALPMIITGLRERGFEFVRLDELLALPNAARDLATQL